MTGRTKLLGTLIFSGLIVPIVYAQTDSGCGKIADDRKRLDCYDRAQIDPKPSQTLQSRTVRGSPSQTAMKPDFDIDTMDYNQIFSYEDVQQPWDLTPHLPNYFLPASYNNKPNEALWEQLRPGANIDDLEVKFQISGKVKFLNDVFGKKWDLWFGYSQIAWWQLYNGDESAPFRETNYMPEIIASYFPEVSFLGMKLQKAEVSLIHQSNGRGEPLSRSWNRIYANFVFTRGNWGAIIKPWYRIPEDEDDDDNRDIDDFLGYGDYHLLYKRGHHILSLQVRNNFRSENRGSGKLVWAFPLNESVKGYVEYFNGYGESLIDYNHYVNRVSFGILIYDWL